MGVENLWDKYQIDHTFMYQQKQKNKDIYTLQYLKLFQQPTHHNNTAIAKLSAYVRLSSKHIFIQNIKLFTKILTFYLKQQNKSLSKATEISIGQLLSNLKKKLKELPKAKPSQLTYIFTKLMKYSNTHANFGGMPEEQVNKMNENRGEELSITYANYQRQQQLPKMLTITNQLWLYIAQNQLQLPNPNCIECSEYFYQDPQTHQYRKSQYSTLCEGYVIKDTGQFCLAVGYTDNPLVEDDLSKAITVGLNCGGGYVLVTNENSQKITGILFTNDNYISVYNKIQESIRYIQPLVSKQCYSIKFLQVVNSISQGFQSQNNKKSIKFIFKIRLRPNKNWTYYVQNKIKSNKSSYKFYHKLNNKISQIYEENIYEQIMKKYQQKQKYEIKYRCPTCVNVAYPQIDLSLLSKNNENNIENNAENFIQIDESSDQPILKYKNYAVLAISSGKYEAELIEKIRNELKSRKILITLNKPFTKYTSLAERAIWFMSHDCQFNYLNNIIMQVDKQGKCRAIIVTKFLKLRDFVQPQKLQRMRNALNQMFKTVPKCQPGYEKLQSNNSQSSKLIKCTFYGFEEWKHSIFSYIYLDNMGVRAEFVKEYHFKTQHKVKK